MKSDTHPAIAALMIEGYRRMTPAEKLTRIDSLSSAVRQLSAARIRAEHPDADEREVQLRVAALLYPPALMKRAFDWPPDRSS